jgi:hypothetical protein
MKISIIPVRRSLSMATVRRSPVIVNITMLIHHFWQYPFVDIPSRKIGLSEIGYLVRVVEFKAVGFSKLII